MPTRERARDRGEDRARRLIGDIGRELRTARVQHGLSLRDVGATAGLSTAAVSRIERGLVTAVSIRNLARLTTAVGLDLSVRAFPAGEPIRDAAHVALLAKLRAILHGSLRWATEVPLPVHGDRRAWDALIREPRAGWRIGVEAETRPRDLQALTRRVALKHRDGGVDHVLLLLAATRHNRRLVGGHESDLVATFPLPGRRMVELLRAGVEPTGSSIVLL